VHPRRVKEKKWADEWVPPVGDPLKTKGYAAFPAVGLKGRSTAMVCLPRLDVHTRRNPNGLKPGTRRLTGRASEASAGVRRGGGRVTVGRAGPPVVAGPAAAVPVAARSPHPTVALPGMVQRQRLRRCLRREKDRGG
jgi:hypothetical protein